MDWLERHCAIFQAPAVILHLGAGAGADLPAWNRFPGSRVILVEPLPDLAAQLRRETADREHLRVLQVAVGPEDGRARLHRYNQPLYSSLKASTRLADLLPGLARVAEPEVQVRTLATLVDELGLRPGQDNWLVLDAPGMEPSVLDQLALWTEPPLFTQLFLSAGVEALYEGGEPAQALLNRARELGYAVTGAPDRADPDWPRWHLGFQEALIEARDREQAQNKRMAELKEQLAEATASIEAQRGEFNKQLADATATIQARQADLERRDAEAQEHQDRIAQLDKVMEQTKSDLSVSLRLQALREHDLRELQSRYAAVRETRDAQHELLLKLRERLGLAAEYLQQLQHESDEERKSELTSGLVRTLSRDLAHDPAKDD